MIFPWVAGLGETVLLKSFTLVNEVMVRFPLLPTEGAVLREGSVPLSQVFAQKGMSRDFLYQQSQLVFGDLDGSIWLDKLHRAWFEQHQPGMFIESAPRLPLSAPPLPIQATDPLLHYAQGGIECWDRGLDGFVPALFGQKVCQFISCEIPVTRNPQKGDWMPFGLEILDEVVSLECQWLVYHRGVDGVYGGSAVRPYGCSSGALLHEPIFQLVKGIYKCHHF